jgi:threonine dehydrogenase-like Zn-dependent dehydrogenase
MYATTEERADVIVIASDRQARVAWSVSRGLVERERMVPLTRHVAEELRERCGDGLDAVYVCTPRAATRSAIALAETLVRDGGCIDIVAGVSAAREDRMRGELDLGEVRERNTCGLPVAAATCRVVLEDGRTIRLVGQRGTAARHMRRAMACLVDGRTPFVRVISHVVPLAAAPDLMLEMAEAMPRRRFQSTFMKVAVLVRPVEVGADVTLVG